MEHGKLGSYTNHGCRCDLCKAVNSEYAKSYKAKRYAGGRGMGIECKFGGCGREAMMDCAKLCDYHEYLMLHLIKIGTRTKEEIEFACCDD